MLNIDLKFFSKALAAKLQKSILPSLTTYHQTVYVQNRHVGEAGRLISDILDISDKLNVDDYLVLVNIEKAFHSLDHGILLVIFKKFGFGNNFTDSVKILWTNQVSCVISGSSTTSYFKLEKGAHQGDSISAYLLIIALEMFLQW